MKRRRFYEKPSEQATREKADAARRARKLARKQAIRDGLIAAPKKNRFAKAPQHSRCAPSAIARYVPPQSRYIAPNAPTKCIRPMFVDISRPLAVDSEIQNVNASIAADLNPSAHGRRGIVKMPIKSSRCGRRFAGRRCVNTVEDEFTKYEVAVVSPCPRQAAKSFFYFGHITFPSWAAANTSMLPFVVTVPPAWQALMMNAEPGVRRYMLGGTHANYRSRRR
jgi:hypothetical protein